MKGEKSTGFILFGILFLIVAIAFTVSAQEVLQGGDEQIDKFATSTLDSNQKEVLIRTTDPLYQISQQLEETNRLLWILVQQGK